MARDRIILRKEVTNADEIWSGRVRNEVYNSDTMAWEAETITNAGPESSTTSAVTSVAASTSSVVILAANSSREGFSVFNDSSSALYLKLGTTASTSSFTVKMVAASYFECPFNYTGAVAGIWDTATGNARITEFT